MESPHWSGIPLPWLWQSRALASERAWNWPVALTCWLQCSSIGCSGAAVVRATAVALGFLVVPAVLRHRLSASASGLAHFRQGSSELESTALAAMAPPARWLLVVLSELEPRLPQGEQS